MPLQPIDRDAVLRLVREKGPVIPNDLKQQLKLGDTILLGAMLSEMASKGHVKISHVKKGGSPYYYDPNNPAQLEKAADSLNEKDRRTYALLKEKRVLRDDEHEALTRVSLRNLKDYAVAQTVARPDGDVLYWRYFLVDDAEFERRVHGIPSVQEQPPKPEPAAAPGVPASPASSPQIISSDVPAPKKKRVKKEKPAAAAPTQQTLMGTVPVAAPGVVASASAPAPLPADDFTQQVLAFFAANSIAVKEQKPVKKGELEFVIEMATPIGPVVYFCKARAKKTNNEGDLAAAKLQGAARHLPVVYVTNGDLNKRAKEMLASELQGVVVKKLG